MQGRLFLLDPLLDPIPKQSKPCSCNSKTVSLCLQIVVISDELHAGSSLPHLSLTSIGSVKPEEATGPSRAHFTIFKFAQIIPHDQLSAFIALYPALAQIFRGQCLLQTLVHSEAANVRYIIDHELHMAAADLLCKSQRCQSKPPIHFNQARMERTPSNGHENKHPKKPQ